MGCTIQALSSWPIFQAWTQKVGKLVILCIDKLTSQVGELVVGKQRSKRTLLAPNQSRCYKIIVMYSSSHFSVLPFVHIQSYGISWSDVLKTYLCISHHCTRTAGLNFTKFCTGFATYSRSIFRRVWAWGFNYITDKARTWRIMQLHILVNLKTEVKTEEQLWESDWINVRNVWTFVHMMKVLEKGF